MGDEIENANVIRVQTLPRAPDYPRVEWIASLGPTGRGAIHAVGASPTIAVRKLLGRVPDGWPWDRTWCERDDEKGSVERT